jgi:tetratricopeptide (TPR) repeat protein
MPPRQPFRQNTPDPAARPLAKAMEHHRAGRLAEAEKQYRVALALAPRHSDASRLLGRLYVEDGRPEQALPLLKNALQAQPDNPEVLYCLGESLRALDKFEEALDCYGKVLQSRPMLAAAYISMGLCWRELGKPEAALDCFEKALCRNPDDADALSNLGAVLLDAGHSAQAHETLERALQVKPDHVGAIVNLGVSLYDEGKINAALEHYNRALIKEPKHLKSLFLKSYALLALGEYREGWNLYEAGVGRRDMRGHNPFAAVKPWDGKSAPGKRLLIWSEQGLGDSLQFIRYAELCKQRVGKVSVLCPKPLTRLFKTLPFVDDAFDTPQEGRSNFDEHVPMMSLPHLFDSVLETVPAPVTYLRVDSEIQAQWATEFAGVTSFKVGLVWAGGSHQHNVATNRIDRQRSIGLERMRPWLDLEGARFYSLQKDKPAGQIAALGLADRLSDFMSEVADFADTAAIVQNLDLVITVDTSVAHLAGGLGKPVWILSRYNACWRWLQNRPTNPWYPTARIFGQPSMGDWDSVIAEVGRELVKEIARKSGAATTNFVLSSFRGQ